MTIMLKLLLRIGISSENDRKHTAHGTSAHGIQTKKRFVSSPIRQE